MVQLKQSSFSTSTSALECLDHMLPLAFFHHVFHTQATGSHLLTLQKFLRKRWGKKIIIIKKNEIHLQRKQVTDGVDNGAWAVNI